MEASRASVAAICHVPCFFIIAMSSSSTGLSRTLWAKTIKTGSDQFFRVLQIENMRDYFQAVLVRFLDNCARKPDWNLRKGAEMIVDPDFHQIRMMRRHFIHVADGFFGTRYLKRDSFHSMNHPRISALDRKSAPGGEKAGYRWPPAPLLRRESYSPEAGPHP